MPTWFMVIATLIAIEEIWRLRSLAEKASDHLESIEQHLRTIIDDISSIEHEVSLPRKDREFEKKAGFSFRDERP